MTERYDHLQWPQGEGNIDNADLERYFRYESARRQREEEVRIGPCASAPLCPHFYGTRRPTCRSFRSTRLYGRSAPSNPSSLSRSHGPLVDVFVGSSLSTFLPPSANINKFLWRAPPFRCTGRYGALGFAPLVLSVLRFPSSLAPA